MSTWSEARVVMPGRHAFLPYYTTSPWSCNGDFFVFFSVSPDFSDPQLYAYYPATGSVKLLSELAGWRGRAAKMMAAMAKTDQKLADGSVMQGARFVEEELLTSVFLPKLGKMLIPRGHELFSISIADGSESKFYSYADARYRIGGPGQSDDAGKRVVFGAFYPVNCTPASSVMLILDAASGKEMFRHDFGSFFANHYQFTHLDNELIFAHEGPTEGIPDRVNLIDIATGKTRVMHHHIRQNGELVEYIGHEKVAGKVVGAVRYPVSKIPGGLLIMDRDGHCQLADADDYWHCAGTADGSDFFMDTMWWGNTRRKTKNVFDIVHFNAKTKEKEILRTFAAEPVSQFRHPHPQPDATGKHVLFIQCGETPDYAGIALLTRQN